MAHDLEHIARLEWALRYMPRRRREVVLAVRLDAMSYSEIAERTGLSVEQVEEALAQALLDLDAALDNSVPPPWWRRLFQRLSEPPSWR